MILLLSIKRKMKQLRLVVILAILLLSNCLSSWSRSSRAAGVEMSHVSTGEGVKSDTISTVSIDIAMIRAANEKLISYYYLRKEVSKKDSIIIIQDKTINDIRNLMMKAEQNYNRTRVINEKLTAQLSVYKKQQLYLAGISVGAVVALLVSIIHK
nr:MAG TPA: hemolysin [Crassvirales sp.]